MNRWLIWLDGFVNALLHGMALGFTVCVVDPTNFNLGQGWKNLVTVMGVSSVSAALNYIKQSPLPIAPRVVGEGEPLPVIPAQGK